MNELLQLQNLTYYILFSNLLGRDEDAYNFIKFWLQHQNEAPQNYKTLEEGGFLHLKNQDKEEQLALNSQVSLAFLVALLAIKMKNVQKYEERKSKSDKFEEKMNQRPGHLKNAQTAIGNVRLF